MKEGTLELMLKAFLKADCFKGPQARFDHAVGTCDKCSIHVNCETIKIPIVNKNDEIKNQFRAINGTPRNSR